MADAYKIKQDVTVPRAVQVIGEDVEGNPVYETRGKLYTTGSYIRAEDITPPLRKKAEDGELDQFFEAVSKEEMDDALLALRRADQFSTFAPEHEVERVTLANYGHDVLSRKQVLEMNSAGAEDAKNTLEAAQEDGADERPAITEAKTFVEVPSLADASREGKTVLPEGDVPYEPEIDTKADSIQTMPSGVIGGATKTAAEGGTPPSADEGDKPKPRARKRPGQSNDKAPSSGEGAAASGGGKQE